MKSTLFLFALITALIFSGCTTTSVYVDVLEPARINIPQKYQKLVIVNRSLPAKGEKGKNIVEGLFSGEGLFNDRYASYECVEGLNYRLNENERFEAVLCSDCELFGTGTAEWPVPVRWDTVAKICNTYNADALVALEVLDSDKNTHHRTHQHQRKRDGATETYITHSASMEIMVRTGWRIYDPKAEHLIDQNRFEDFKTWDANGDTRNEAFGRLPSPKQAVKQAGYYAGEEYAARISPIWVKSRRSVYIKGNEDMESAKDLVRSGQWDEAAAIWKKYTDAEDSKLAARACFNMAVASEILGNIDAAINWAQKSYELHSTATTREYVNLLFKRQQDFDTLNQQLGEE